MKKKYGIKNLRRARGRIKKDSHMKKGKILKVKIGYNPNSSSIGTLLKAFPCALFGSAVLFNIVAGIIFSRKFKTPQKDKKGKK